MLEDDPYSLLRFEGEPVKPLQAYAPENTIYFSTSSKLFAPALRDAHVVAPKRVIQKLKSLVEETVKRKVILYGAKVLPMLGTIHQLIVMELNLARLAEVLERIKNG